MSEQTVSLGGVTRALSKLDDAYQLGRSVEHPGLIDAARAGSSRMGGMLEQMRALHADRVEELRQRNQSEVTP